MGAEHYEVVIVIAKTGARTNREWSRPQLLKSVPWLKRMNAQGADIYVRPLDGPELLLVDGLGSVGLKVMRSKGFTPAVIIETNRGRFQAWVKLSDQPVSAALRKQAVSNLAGVFPVIGQYGRLAGFTNQTAEKKPAKGQRYVLAHDSTGTITPAAQLYPAAIEWNLHEFADKKQRCSDADKPLLAPKRDRGRSHPV